MKQQLLLLDDVVGLGRQGEIVSAKPGFVRNFLLPQKKAVVANKSTLKLQARLKEERAKKSLVDKKESEILAKELVGKSLSITVKTDTQGKLYGSVTALEIANLAKEAGFPIEKQNIALSHPLKTLGKHTVSLRLKEQVEASIFLEILPEHPESIVKKKNVKESESEAVPVEASTENEESTEENIE